MQADILLIEDDPDIAENVWEYLNNQSGGECKVTIADNGIDGAQLASEEERDRRSHCPLSEDKKQLYEQKIMDEIDRMDVLTERLLSLFRVSAGESDIAEEEFAVGDICRELIQNYVELSGKRGLTWKITENESFMVRADKTLFSMALDNLINNACKYSLVDSEILVTIEKNCLTMENRWAPIEKFLRNPKLFWEPYVTGDEARTSKSSGIDLSSARQILRRMKIKIAVKADEEKILFQVRR